MSKEKKPIKFNQLSDLSNLFSKEELDEKKYIEEKQKFQENWVRNTNGQRKMIAKNTNIPTLNAAGLIIMHIFFFYFFIG